MRDDHIERTSVCVVTSSNLDIPLLRLADIENNRLIPFRFDDGRPWYFDNRNRIVLQDGPSEDGRIGVWKWTATPRNTDYEKDYIESRFVPEISPVEIIEVSSVFTLDDLVNELNQGVEINHSGINSVYCCRSKSREYTGILCTAGQFEVVNGRQRLKESIISLPLYHISFNDIVRTEGHIFYQYLFLPDAEEKALIKSPMDIVREVVIRRSSWTAMKAAGFSKNEFKHLKEYLSEISNDSLYEEIADSVGFSVGDAKKYVNEFTYNVESYLDQEDIEDQVLESIVDNHEELRTRVEEKIESRWQKDHQEEIKNAQKELSDIVAKKESQQVELTRLSDEIGRAYDKLADTGAEIEKKKKLAEDVEKGVAERIQKAKEDAAAFISEMAFVSPNINVVSDSGKAITDKKKEAPVISESNTNCSELYQAGDYLPEDDLESCHSWNDTVQLLGDELFYESGINENDKIAVAAYLYAAYANKIPVLVAGPNANSIADAFSAALYGKLSDRFVCTGEYRTPVFNNEEEKRTVITISAPFNSDWIDHIPELLSDPDAQYFLTVPFAEDLVLEPKGLYNYALPFFTEPFVIAKPSNHFEGGKKEAGYSEFQLVKTKRTYDQLLRKNGASRLFTGELQSVLTNMHAIMGGGKIDYDYILGLLPYFYSTGHGDALLNRLDEETQISSTCIDCIRAFLGAPE